MGYHKAARFILEEMRAAVDAVALDDVDRFIKLLDGAKSVVIFGRGRSGLVGRAFAMRLVHLGFRAYVVGETISPPVHADDVVVLISGSGETFSVAVTGQIAKKIGSRIVAITSAPGTTLEELAELTISLPTRPSAEQRELAPLGTIFEDACTLFLDGVVAELMVRHKETEDSMRARHATLE